MQQRVTTMLALIVSAVCTVPTYAQARDNFAGTWILAKAQPHDSAIGAGEQLAKAKRVITITQNDRELTIGSPGQSNTYRLDGTETIHYVMVGNDSVPESGRARWEGRRLILLKVSEHQGVRWEITQWLALSPSGQLNMGMKALGPGRRVHGQWVFDRAAADAGR